jgi:predicted DNA-binding ribbon-helix-helix protein
MSAAAKMRRHSVTLSGHKTSISLEDGFWEELKRIAAARGLSMNALVTEIDKTRSGNLSSALRMLVLEDLHQPSGNSTGLT